MERFWAGGIAWLGRGIVKALWEERVALEEIP